MMEALTQARSGKDIRYWLSAIDMPNSMCLEAGKYDTMAKFWAAMTNAPNMIHLMSDLGIGKADQRLKIAEAMIRETEFRDKPGFLVCNAMRGIRTYIFTGKRDEEAETAGESYMIGCYDLLKRDAAENLRSPGMMAAVCYSMMALADHRVDYKGIFELIGIPKIPAHADIIRRFIPSPFG